MRKLNKKRLSAIAILQAEIDELMVEWRKKHSAMLWTIIFNKVQALEEHRKYL